MDQHCGRNRVKAGKDNKPRERGRLQDKMSYIHRQILGKIKFFDYKRGYGFLVSKDVCEDVFFHFTSIFSKLEEIILQPNEAFIFDVARGPRGLRAKNIFYVGPRGNESEMFDADTFYYQAFKTIVGSIINEDIQNGRLYRKK